MAFEIRPAREADMPAVARINRHYILNTVMTFKETVGPLDTYVDTLRAVAAEGLPYLVAVARDSSAPITADVADADAAAPAVLGYAYAKAFRADRPAYRYAVELTLFCDPEHTGRGLGSALLTTLLDAVKTTTPRPAAAAAAAAAAPGHPSHLADGDTAAAPRPIRHVLAVMAVDDQGQQQGRALKAFYERFGFGLVRLF
ncbi:Acyl-CoA N-acyltransferase [Niveomyces insectorum RCEF 264]|uniref:Acyl-CoA N-acyltransferase n=1 Tax=Niveomyces insectorum RCEF 264 TaxID=1081102 RepID=A0A167U2Z5_9HYPO|nr:Acyl-CoA N-acyltransferase [Niveomyces insectorum RCEF 264]